MSQNERKHPAITEPSLSLSSAQAESLAALRNSLSPEFSDPFTDNALLRFLEHHSWQVPAAATAWKNYLQWRQDLSLDSWLSAEFSHSSLIAKLIPYAYHQFDNENRPIYWEKTGKIQCAALADPAIIDPKIFLDSHIWGMEYIFQKAFEKSLETGKRIDQFTSILDMNGLGFHHRSALFVLKSCMDLDSLYYPQRIGKLYILNTPWVAPAIYQLVQPLCPRYVTEKVFIVDGNPNEFLLSVIPSVAVPPEYGGACQCPGGCLAELDATELMNAAKRVDGLDTQTVDYDYSQSIDCPSSGCTVTWFFECEGGYDIDFAVKAVQADQSTTVVKEKSRCTTSQGSYESTGPCRLTFDWDNNFSYFNSKTIKFSITMGNTNIKDLKHSS